MASEVLVQGSSLGAWGQATTGSGTGSVSVSWAQARVSGSLLILCVTSDGTHSTPIGWTLARQQVNNSAVYIFYRIADNTGSDTPTLSNGAATLLAWAEYSNNTASPLDQVASGGSSTGSTSRSTGTTGTTAQADEVAVAVWSWSKSGAVATWSGQTNSFSEIIDTGTTKGAGNNCGLCLATKSLSATGTVTSTATLSGSFASGATVATFKFTAPTPSATILNSDWY